MPGFKSTVRDVAGGKYGLAGQYGPLQALMRQLGLMQPQQQQAQGQSAQAAGAGVPPLGQGMQQQPAGAGVPQLGVGVSPEIGRSILQEGGMGALGGIGGISQQGLDDPNADWLDKLEKITLGREPQFLRAPRFTEGQFQQLGDILGAGSQALGEQPYSFAPIEKQARERFEQQTVPGLAERFAGLGALGSSSFGRSMGEAGRGFERDLAAEQSKFALQRMDPLSRLLGLGLTDPYVSNLQAGGQGMLPGLMAGLAKAGTSYATGGLF